MFSRESSEEKAAGPEPEKQVTSVTSAQKRLELGNITEDPVEASVLFTLDNPYHPFNWPIWQKYLITIIYCTLQTYVTLTSTSYVAIEFLVQERFGVSTQVSALGQSMFILGTAIGPAFLGPLSDIGGRKWVYVFSTLLYVIFNFGKFEFVSVY
ncbi:hypothetical protein KL921_001135 [Ogataea angusta]|uniref:Major facilitator superfamily (MFS) profile domain-containing protein n=1 Tax=Pichia angusta TaxID=870730 RepID=A0AAN6I6Y6_PICAN|nr:uncharacterized protein KL928_001302 [Ogataea angusta]KAG7813589.1 hypothetical protein KL921_001135 [Ogataea angusta]KAG7821218.1 hypothetical protein KL928_001302 [Ogataea angusta]KAG7826080.1 hypothetical protein KL909_000132 [Ogataea angusta]KAG7832173.1 hypothetical protein KL920_000508 [Ogataea angusta]KAG7836346.1 hypothetical protein KL943_001995 [Ogataea angusta]